MDTHPLPHSPGRVTRLGLDRVDETADLLAEVFFEYPLDRYIVDGLGEAGRSVLARSYRVDCLRQLGLGYPLLGVLEGNRVAAAAVVLAGWPSEGGFVQYEGGPLTAARLQEMEDRLDQFFGEQACKRMLAYCRLRDAHRPRQPHYYLESLAVLPRCRGRGYGSMLINEVSRLSEMDMTSAGVALDTQDPANVDLYRHFGYRVTGEGRLGPVHNWFLFRPNPRRSAEA